MHAQRALTERSRTLNIGRKALSAYQRHVVHVVCMVYRHDCARFTGACPAAPRVAFLSSFLRLMDI